MKDFLPLITAVVAAAATAWIALRNLAVQHAHDRQMKKIERDQQLKKQIYIDALPTVDALLQIVPSLTDTRGEVDDIMQTYLNRAPEYSAMLLVASVRTAKALSLIKEAVGKHASRVLPPAHAIREYHKLHVQRTADLQKIDSLMIDRIATSKNAGAQDEDVREFFVARNVELIQDLEIKLVQARQFLGTACAMYYSEIVDLHLELIAAMRADLGDDIDTASYRPVFAAHLPIPRPSDASSSTGAPSARSTTPPGQGPVPSA